MGLVKLKDVEPIKHIENMLADVQIGSETTFGNMTMFPLFRGKSGRPDYLTLDEALARGSARVTEV